MGLAGHGVPLIKVQRVFIVKLSLTKSTSSIIGVSAISACPVPRQEFSLASMGLSVFFFHFCLCYGNTSEVDSCVHCVLCFSNVIVNI
jgi:hypothetical protein